MCKMSFCLQPSGNYRWPQLWIVNRLYRFGQTQYREYKASKYCVPFSNIGHFENFGRTKICIDSVHIWFSNGTAKLIWILTKKQMAHSMEPNYHVASFSDDAHNCPRNSQFQFQSQMHQHSLPNLFFSERENCICPTIVGTFGGWVLLPKINGRRVRQRRTFVMHMQPVLVANSDHCGTAALPHRRFR